MTYQPKLFKPGEAPPEKDRVFGKSHTESEEALFRRMDKVLFTKPQPRVSTPLGQRWSTKPYTAREMSEIEAAWLGAIVEGEGTIRNDKAGHPRIVVYNSDPEVISACIRITGIGTVTAVHFDRYYKGAKLGYQFGIYTLANVLSILERIRPYCMKAQKLLEIRNALPT